MEINMGSSSEGAESMVLKRKLHIRAKPVDTTSLQELGQRLSTLQQLTFAKKYGNILSLMRVDVQEGAITALAQYYDPPLRCFTFQDFQLAPTLEEYEQILDLPLEGRDPYRHIEHHASPRVITSTLKLQPQDLQQVNHGKKQNKGFTRKYLEGYMCNLADAGDWATFMDVLALTIFGIVLFPNAEHFVDLAAIDVFLACRNNSENPVTALLADVYCTMNFCHERKGKKIICCLPMLYVWLTSHIFRRNVDIKCPIADLLQYQLSTKDYEEWANHMASLTEGLIRWHPSWQQRTVLIYHCKGFLNVPLMGTKGCINYNPIMGQRQIAYPMMGPPAEELLTPFVFYYDTDENYTEQLRKVRDSWDKVTRKGKELGTRSCAARGSYRQWVKDRVQQIKLPFKTPDIESIGEPSEPELFEDEEVKELKATLKKVLGDNKKMEEELLRVRQTCASLKRENNEKQRRYEEMCEQQKHEREYAKRIQHCIRDANRELGLRISERDAALVEKKELWDALNKVKKERNEAKSQIGVLQAQIDDMKQQIEGIVAACEAEINIEKWQLIEVMDKFQVTVDRMDAEIFEKNDAIKHWMKQFAQLACLANSAIDGLPTLLKEAEISMHPFDTPEEIRTFIGRCRELIRELNRMITRAREG